MELIGISKKDLNETLSCHRWSWVYRGEFCLSFGKPMMMNDYLNFTIKEFNKFLNEEMIKVEEIALKNVGR